MFANGKTDGNETVIAEGLKIEGNVTADGLVRVHGTIIGDLRCASLIISDKATITGTVEAGKIIVDGTVDGPVRGTDVVLKSQARITGDIHHETLSIEKGALFDGRSKQTGSAAGADEAKKSARDISAATSA